MTRKPLAKLKTSGREFVKNCACLMDLFKSNSPGQSSIEAALSIPAFMLVVGLMVQPCLIVYSKIAMRSAAAEACRVYAHQSDVGTGPYSQDRFSEFVQNKLAGVPFVDIFHIGGRQGWEIAFTSEGDRTQVTISHEVKPLPLLGIGVNLLGDSGAHGGVVITTTTSSTLKPSWVKGTYHEWISSWK